MSSREPRLGSLHSCDVSREPNRAPPGLSCSFSYTQPFLVSLLPALINTRTLIVTGTRVVKSFLHEGENPHTTGGPQADPLWAGPRLPPLWHPCREGISGLETPSHSSLSPISPVVTSHWPKTARSGTSVGLSGQVARWRVDPGWGTKEMQRVAPQDPFSPHLLQPSQLLSTNASVIHSV